MATSHSSQGVTVDKVFVGIASIKLQLDVVDRSHDETAELAAKVFELSQTLTALSGISIGGELLEGVVSMVERWE